MVNLVCSADGLDEEPRDVWVAVGMGAEMIATMAVAASPDPNGWKTPHAKTRDWKTLHVAVWEERFARTREPFADARSKQPTRGHAVEGRASDDAAAAVWRVDEPRWPQLERWPRLLAGNPRRRWLHERQQEEGSKPAAEP